MTFKWKFLKIKKKPLLKEAGRLSKQGSRRYKSLQRKGRPAVSQSGVAGDEPEGGSRWVWGGRQEMSPRWAPGDEPEEQSDLALNPWRTQLPSFYLAGQVVLGHRHPVPLAESQSPGWLRGEADCPGWREHSQRETVSRTFEKPKEQSSRWCHRKLTTFRALAWPGSLTSFWSYPVASECQSFRRTSPREKRRTARSSAPRGWAASVAAFGRFMLPVPWFIAA